MVYLERTLRWNGAQRDDLAFFAGIQANILKGHGRKHVRLLFLQFDSGNPEVARRLIKEIARGITSTQDQLTQAQLRQSRGRPGGPLVSLMLTASAYEVLALGPWPGDPETMDLPTMGVTRKSASRLFRRHLTQDQEATDAGKIHALLLIAHGNDASDPHAINHVESNYYNLIYSAFVGGSPVARVVGRERGTLLEERGLPREHFGYPDGRSQVLVLDDDIEVERVKSGGTFVAWDPSVPASRVVKGVEWTETVEDAEGNREDTLAGYGSFFVFQKWEQNVRAFASEIRQVGDSTGKAPEAVKALSGALGGARAYVGRSGVLPRDVSRASREAAEATRAEAGKAGADVLGRFDDGYPRALADVGGIRTDVPNDFAYSAVPSGPLSHMQAANPRRRLNKLATAQGAWRDPLLFPRRGMPYDDRPGSEQRARPTPGEGGFVYDPSEYPEKDVGLLFMAYNSDLRTQFVPGFEKVKGDRLLNGRAQSVQRPVISRKERRDRGLDGPFLRDAPAEQGDPAEAPAAGANAEAEPEAEIKPGDGGERFVTLKGGEYFFVPPIEFLRHIDRVIL